MWAALWKEWLVFLPDSRKVTSVIPLCVVFCICASFCSCECYWGKLLQIRSYTQMTMKRTCSTTWPLTRKQPTAYSETGEGTIFRAGHYRLVCNIYISLWFSSSWKRIVLCHWVIFFLKSICSNNAPYDDICYGDPWLCWHRLTWRQSSYFLYIINCPSIC